MSVAASDIIVYGSASMPDDDSTQNIGGAIDTSKRVVFTDISPSGTVEVVSSVAGDTTQTITVTGRNAAGEIISDTKTLNGTTPVAITGTFERLLKAVINAAHTGAVTLRKSSAGGDLMVFEPGVLEIRRPFYNASADAAGGSQRKYYEKIFFKNTHATLSLTSAQISEQSDASGKIAFALESTLNGTDTNGAGNNRQAAPGGYTFNSTAKNVANSQNHTAGAGQGVWLELTLEAGDAATKTTYTLRESGTST
jgi:hypothetical protein